MINRYSPEDAIKLFDEIRADTPNAVFFNKPNHQKTQELWCAAMFTLGYKQHFQDAWILIDECDLQLDFDFELEFLGNTYPIQVTEVMKPGRKRGDEYKEMPKMELCGDDWELGEREGKNWVKSSIQKKIEKYMDGCRTINLLLYLNFEAYSQEYKDIVMYCNEVTINFSSVWLLTGKHFCCIKPHHELKSKDGWCRIEL